MELLSPTEVEDQVIDGFERRLDDVVARLAAEVERQALFVNAADERFLGALRNAVIAELHAGVVGYRLDRRLPAAPPAETADLARRAANAGVPLSALLTFYMVALNIYWEAIHQAILSTPATRETHNTVVTTGTRYLHEYMAHLATLAAKEYGDERERSLRRRTLRRLAVVRDVLSGSAGGDAVLGYNLRATHVALVATGPGAEEAIAALREAASPRALTVADDETIWAWLSGDAAQLTQLERLVASSAGTTPRIGVGRRQDGPDGFRITHRQAATAHELAVRFGRSSVRYEAIALATLAVSDPRTTSIFIADELRPLIGDEQRSERLLETLYAYLESGQNGTTTAARLGTSARTVSHRLRLIEEALGRPVASRAAELHAALRMRRLELGEI
jgi:hypothetical protein